MIELDPARWFAFALLAAAVAVDGGPWLLAMLARPLPAAAALGLAWGDPAGGAWVGAVLELVYAGVLPVGAARYPDAGVAGLVGAGVALWPAAELGAPALVPGVACGLIAGHVGRGVESWRRARNAERVARARARARGGEAGALCRVVRRSIARGAAEGVAVATALLAAGMLVSAPLLDLAPRVAALRPPAVLLAALGCGAVLRLWPGRAIRLGLTGGVLAGLLVVLAFGGGGT
ncbi:MAG: PTS sugar transporter subunit IIC [Gemmatimonadota bacterium]